MKHILVVAWGTCLSNVQGNKEKRTKRISNTVSEVRTQMTKQIAKSIAGTSGFAGRQGNTARVPGGFTIIEILIATAVFSVVLMIALSGFLQIGRLFYKGTINAQGQDITQRIAGQISSDIRTASNITLAQKVGNINYYCLGNNRYTVSLGTEVGTDKSFALLRDSLPGGLACAAPCSSDYTGIAACPGTTDPAVAPLTNPTELLGDKMRLGVFSVAYTAPGWQTDAYNVSLRVISGDDEVLSIPNVTDPSTIKCDAQLSVSQYCSSNELNTTIFRGF